MNLEKIAAVGAMLIVCAALGMSFLAIKADGLENRLAFGAIVGLLIALVFLGVAKLDLK